MRTVRAVAAVLALAAACAGRPAPDTPAPFPRQAIIGDLQAFGEGLGMARTGNFQRFVAERPAVYRCYYTGLLELPATYEALALVESEDPGCPIDDNAFDVFFYAIEAVASGASPVSPSLAEAPLERTLVVVPHEDFHNQPEAARAPFEVAEPAATLVGFLAARAFALARYGADSEVFARLDAEPERFRAKARLVNAYFDRVAAVYAAHDAGTITREAALARKAELYAALDRDCRALERAVSFNTCPAAMNNAGLAFDRTYVRHYEAWHDLYETLGRDTAATVATVRRVLDGGPSSAEDLRRALAGAGR